MGNNPYFNNPKHWRDRAEEARTLAEQMNDDLSRRVMREIAQDYDKLAVRASLRLASDGLVPAAPDAQIRRSNV